MILVCVLATLAVAYLAIGFIEADFSWIVDFMDRSTADDRARFIVLIMILLAFGTAVGIVCS